MPEEPKEKKELLAREEVRTMEKDIARLREEEAQRERERITKLKTEEEAQRERERMERKKREVEEREKAAKEAREKMEAQKATQAQKEAGEREKREEERKRQEEIKKTEREKKIIEEIRKIAEKIKKEEEKGKARLAKGPSRFRKIFIRVALIIILLLIFVNLFLFWYWYLKKEMFPWFPGKLPEKEIIPPTEEIPEIVIPPSLISVEATQTLEISAIEEIPNLLFQTLQKDFRETYFTRIVIENIEENKIPSLKEFFEVFGISAPEGFFQKIEDDFTLFIYSQEAGNRLGLVAKIKDYYPPTLINSWETSMENDFENLFLLMGKEKPALVSYFRDGNYQGINLRFQTFTKEDLGICYSIFEDFFIFTSSWESIEKIIDRLTE